MASSKLDIRRGTMMRRGFANSRYDRAVRLGRVTGLNGNIQDNSTAISTALAAAGTAHHSLTSLPLLFIQAQKTGKTEAMVQLHYGRRNIGSTPVTSVALAEVRLLYEMVTWWDDPASQSPTAKTAYDPKLDATIEVPSILPVPIWRFTIWAEQTTSPVSSMTFMAGATNNSSYSLGGTTFFSNTLRFDGLTQTLYSDPDGSNLTFAVGYHYAHRGDNPTTPSGFVESYLDSTGTPATRDIYRRVNFIDPPLT